jgi:hypothetical protein
MAKGQQRSGREPRKPKAEKPKPVAVVSVFAPPKR